MNYFKSIYEVFKRKEVDSTNNAIQFYMDTQYTLDQCLWQTYLYFKKFGEIKNMTVFDMHSRQRRVSIVEFTTPQEAAAVLLKRRFKIAGKNIVVKPCIEIYFEEYCLPEVSQRVMVYNKLLLKPPRKKSPKNILNILNDDCLYEVFKRIHPSNYHLIADVCVRFNQVLTEMAARKYKESMFHIDDMQLFTLSEANHYLRYFGSSIHRARIVGKNLKLEKKLKIKIILGMMSDHCVNLRYLEINNFGMETQSVNEIAPLLTRISELCVKNAKKDFMYGEYDPVFLPSMNCPKLVSFEWFDDSDYSEIQTKHIRDLTEFLYHNPQLERFVYCNDATNGIKDSTCHIPMNIPLFERFSSLKRLAIINNNSDAVKNEHKQLFQITKVLKKLTIKSVPIEYLDLYNALIDGAGIEYICQMKALKRFTFLDFNCYLHRSPARDVIDSYIIGLECNLPSLEYLQFQTSAYLDLVFTDKLTYLIQKRLQKYVVPEIEFNMQHFDSNAFTDKYNSTTNQNMHRKYFMENDFRDYRLTIRKFPGNDLNVQRYWLTLSHNSEDSCLNSRILKIPKFRWPIVTNKLQNFEEFEN